MEVIYAPRYRASRSALPKVALCPGISFSHRQTIKGYGGPRIDEVFKPISFQMIISVPIPMIQVCNILFRE